MSPRASVVETSVPTAAAGTTETKAVAILGVAGFIGSHLATALLKRTNLTILGVDIAPPDKLALLLGADKPHATRFAFHALDISKPEHAPELRRIIAQADTVVNLAAICNPSEYMRQPVNTIHSNFSDAVPTIKICVELKKHLIHFSTCEVYGRTLSSYGLDATDERNVVLDEESTPMIMGPLAAQRWCYACAKQLVERLIFAHGTEDGLKFTIVRPYNWIGPRMDYIPGVDGKSDGQPRVLASFMTALMRGEPLTLVNGGEVSRTFCYVEDACEAVVRMIERPDKSVGHAFNVGNPQNNLTIAALAELMIGMHARLASKPHATTVAVSGEEYYGKGYEDSDLRIPSMALVSRQLDWAPTTSIGDAMERTMKAFLETYADQVGRQAGEKRKAVDQPANGKAPR